VDLIRVNTPTGSGLFSPEQVRALLDSSRPAKSTSAIPPPRPLSKRAQAHVAQVDAQATERQAAVDRALALGVNVAKAKADDTPQVAVFDAQGNLVGCVPEDRIIPVAQMQGSGGRAAKSMSRGAQRTGQQQLGGPTPRGGVPVVPAQDTDDQSLVKTLAKAAPHIALMKARLQPGSSATAAERVEALDFLNVAATTALAVAQPRPRRR